MQIVIDVIDNLSQTPLAGATISLNGQAVGQTDVNGVYVADINESDLISVSYVGYQPVSVTGGVLESSAQVQLSADPGMMPSVTVTPSNKKNSLLLPLLVAGGVVVAASDKSKSVGKVNKTALYVGAGALGLGAVYLMTRPKATTPTTSQLTASQLIAQTQKSPSALQTVTSLLPSAGNLFSGLASLFSSGPSASNPYDTQVVDPYASYDPMVTAPDPVNLTPMNLDFNVPVSGVGAIDFTSPWTLGALAIGTYLLFGRKKKVGEVKVSEFIIPAGVVVGGYLILKKFNILGPSAQSQNASGISTSTSQGISDSLNNAKASGDLQTITDAQAAALASTIYAAGTSSPVDQDTIQRSIIQANTLTDFLKVAQSFGTKQAGGLMCQFFGDCQTYDLSSFVRATLDSSHLASVNGYFYDQGINYSI